MAFYSVVSALLSEFLGTLMFTFLGNLASPGAAAISNGLALVVTAYCTVSQSGAHLNPNVTTSLVLTGHTAVLQGLGYVVCQLTGAIVGSGISKGFAHSPGCFIPAAGVSQAQLWGWETIMTTLLIVTVFEMAVVQKGASNFGPLIIGLSLTVCAYVGGPYTGAALNFARVLGPAAVNGCGWSHVWVYLLAHITATALSAGWGLFVAPIGPYLSFQRSKAYGHFLPAVPYSSASNPLAPYTNVVSTADHSTPPYARYTEERQNLTAAEHHRRSVLRTQTL